MALIWRRMSSKCTEWTSAANYTLLRSGDGGMSVTVCNDKAGADESLKVAREWIKKNASNIQTNPPIVSEGSVIVEIQ